MESKYQAEFQSLIQHLEHEAKSELDPIKKLTEWHAYYLEQRRTLRNYDFERFGEANIEMDEHDYLPVIPEGVTSKATWPEDTHPYEEKYFIIEDLRKQFVLADATADWIKNYLNQTIAPINIQGYTWKGDKVQYYQLVKALALAELILFNGKPASVPKLLEMFNPVMPMDTSDFGKTLSKSLKTYKAKAGKHIGALISDVLDEYIAHIEK